MSRLTEQLSFQAADNADFTRSIALKNADGTPFNLTGWEFAAQVKSSRDTDAAALVSMAVSVEGDPTFGVLSFDLTRVQMSSLGAGKFFYDVLAKNAEGTISNLWIAEFNVAQGVTTWPTP